MANTNLFEQAISAHALVPFALGTGKYFIADPHKNEHWVLGSWKDHILPFYGQQPNKGAKAVREMLRLLMAYIQPDTATKVSNLLHHVHAHYYLKHEGWSGFSITSVEKDIADYTQQIKATLKTTENFDPLNAIDMCICDIQKLGGLSTIKTP